MEKFIKKHPSSLSKIIIILILTAFLSPLSASAAPAVSVSISSIMGNAIIGSTYQFSASAVDSTGWPVTPQPSTFAWASSDPAVGTVDETGLFTPISAGSVTITAASPGLTNGTVVITVALPNPPSVATAVSISPIMGNAVIGSTYQLSASAVDSTGWPVTPQSFTFTWSSSDPTIGTVDASGIFTPVAVGSVTITASDATAGISGTLTISVVQSSPGVPNFPPTETQVLTTLNIVQFPINNTLQVGQSWGLSFSALDQNGVALYMPPTVAWTSSNTAVATISATPNTQGSYVLTARGAGTTTITASSGEVSGTALLTVTPAPQILGSITISNSPSGGIAIGSTFQYGATVLDTSGLPFSPQPTVYWQSSNPAVATINASGLATAVSPGSTTIWAIYGSANTFSAFNATLAPGTFGITASAGAGGAISPLNFTVVASGASQTYTITPNTGYSIADVLVDNVSVGAVASYTFSNVAASHTIAASFSVIPSVTYTLNASAGANGTISPLGATTVNSGASQTYTITPNTGYSIADVLVDGISVGAVSTYTFTNVIATHTISATFIVAPVVLNNLVVGWNLIGWTNLPTTADAFGLANTGVNLVVKWDAATQLWVSHIVNFPLNNFTINPGDGIFVHKQ